MCVYLCFQFEAYQIYIKKKFVFACVWGGEGGGALGIHLLAKEALAWKSLGATDFDEQEKHEYDK